MLKIRRLKYYLIFIFIFFNIFIYGQQLQKIIKRDPKTNCILEEYNIIVKTSNKHGKYILYNFLPDSALNKNNYVKEEGYYHIGNKEGEWFFYTNFFTEGVHEVYKKEIFTKGKIIKTEKLITYLYPQNYFYPEYAKNNNITGNVVLKAKLNNNCLIKDTFVLQSPDSSLTRAALNSLEKNMKNSDIFNLKADSCLNKEFIMIFKYRLY